MKRRILFAALFHSSVLTAKAQNECGEYIDQYVLPPIMTSQGLGININANYAYSVLGGLGVGPLVPSLHSQYKYLVMELLDMLSLIE